MGRGEGDPSPAAIPVLARVCGGRVTEVTEMTGFPDLYTCGAFTLIITGGDVKRTYRG